MGVETVQFEPIFFCGSVFSEMLLFVRELNGRPQLKFAPNYCERKSQLESRKDEEQRPLNHTTVTDNRFTSVFLGAQPERELLPLGTSFGTTILQQVWRVIVFRLRPPSMEMNFLLLYSCCFLHFFVSKTQEKNRCRRRRCLRLDHFVLCSQLIFFIEEMQQRKKYKQVDVFFPCLFQPFLCVFRLVLQSLCARLNYIFVNNISLLLLLPLLKRVLWLCFPFISTRQFFFFFCASAKSRIVRVLDGGWRKV